MTTPIFSLDTLHRKLEVPTRLLEETEKKISTASSVGLVVGYVFSAVEEHKKVSGFFKIVQRISEIPGYLCLPFSVKDVIKDLISIIRKKQLKEKIRSVFSLIIDAAYVTDGIASICRFLYEWKSVGKNAIKWIPIFNVIYFFVGFISTGLSAEAAILSLRTKKNFTKIQKKLSRVNDINRTDIVIQALTNIKKMDLETVRKDLYISKQADLSERVSSLTQKILTSKGSDRIEAENEAIDLVKKLASRAKIRFGHNLGSLIRDIIETVGAIFTTFTPLPIVGYIILATTGSISCLVRAGQFLFVNKNPFDTTSMCRAKKIGITAKTFAKTCLVFLTVQKQFLQSRVLSLLSQKKGDDMKYCLQS
jgi:hypothetical protein